MRGKTAGLVVLSLALLLPLAAAADTVFWLDTPPDGATVAGLVQVNGWVLDERGVSGVDLYVDGVFVASADLNIARWDVLQAYPWYAGTPAEKPGFRTSFNAGSLTDGVHDLFLRVTFSDSTTEDFGNRSVTVDTTINQAPFGELESPGESQPMNGVFPIMGWALDDDGIEMVEIDVDGLTYSSAIYGIHRPDIHNRFPTIDEAEYSGFLYNLNTSKLTNGVHTLSVRLWDTKGMSRVIGRRQVSVFNNWANLVPFGEIDYPPPDHVMFGVGCSNPTGPSAPPYEDVRSVDLITGWALDPDDGVKWVELLINGTVLKRTTLPNCWWYQDYLMDVDCYGLLREDVFKRFPDVPNSKDSGFDFIIDVADLIINHDYHQGLHYLTVRAGDVQGHIADIATIPVIFDCDDDPDRPTWGDIYTPENMERIQGVFTLTGWALDFDYLPADGVEIWVDGDYLGRATYGWDSPEVVEMFPWYSHNVALHAGWRFDLDTTQLSDGEHQLVVIGHDRYDGRNAFAQRPFVVDNLNRGGTVQHVQGIDLLKPPPVSK